MDIDDNLNCWLESTIVSLVQKAEENKLADYGDRPIFGQPLVAVTPANNPLFKTFQSVVSENHIMPAELMPNACVVSWTLPYEKEIILSNRGRDRPSRLYSLARNNGAALMEKIKERLRDQITEKGYRVAIPPLEDSYDVFKDPNHTFSSNWSERHVAMACGLGRFGLHAALITPQGANVRLTSIVTDLPLQGSIPDSQEHRADCLSNGGTDCGACINRCPIGAISSEGLDKKKCYIMRNRIRDEKMQEYTSGMHMLTADLVKSGKHKQDYSLGCALCQCGVPCETRDPSLTRKNHAGH